MSRPKELPATLVRRGGDLRRMNTATIGTVTSTNIPGALAFPAWLSKAAVGSFLVASFTATWGGIHVGPVQTTDVFLLLTFVVIAAMVLFGNLRFPIPRWLWAPAVALLACATVLQYSPIPAAIDGRYSHIVITMGTHYPKTPGSVVKSAFWIVALLVVPIAAIACTALESRAPKWIMAWFVAGVAVSSLIALTDLIQLTHVAQSLGYVVAGSVTSERETGLADHANTLGLVCVIAAPFAVHFINDSRHRWLPSIALVLLCGSVVASGSRGAQVVFPAAVLAAVVVSPHKKKVMRRLAVNLGAAIFGGLIFLMQSAPGIDKLFRFNGEGKSGDSDSERRDLMGQAWHDFKDYPIFGVGVKHINEAHDIYLQLMSAGGYVLLAGMLIYWFGTFRSCRLATRSGDALGPYLMTSVIAWLGIGAIENALTDRFLYYAIGCAAALAATHRVETPRAGRVTAAVAGHPSTGQPETASAAPAAVPMIEAPRVSRTPTGSLTDRRSVGYSGVTYAPTGTVYKGAPGC